ncbi:MAG: hypothetical protein AAGH64_04235 [Planctomycetota bacterium]
MITARSAQRVCAAVLAAGACAPAQASYTGLVFGALVDPSDGSFFTQVYDISADGSSYVGLTNTFVPRLVSDGAIFNLSGPGGALAISGDGLIAAGGVNSFELPRRWQLADAVGQNIPGGAFPVPASPSVPDGVPFGGGQAFTLNTTGTTANIVDASGGTWVITPDTVYDVRRGFADIEPDASFGANRGMATDAPIFVGLAQIPSQGFGPTRYNYVTGEAEILALPEGADRARTNTQGNQISADGSVVGGSFVFPSESAIEQPGYWDADGNAVRIPALGDRIWGDARAVDPTGNFLGGGLSGVGLQDRAFLHNRFTGETVDLNEVFADILPEGWILFETLHIGENASRLFVSALAPDGTGRVVELQGEAIIPAPGAFALLLGSAGVISRRRRG